MGPGIFHLRTKAGKGVGFLRTRLWDHACPPAPADCSLVPPGLPLPCPCQGPGCTHQLAVFTQKGPPTLARKEGGWSCSQQASRRHLRGMGVWGPIHSDSLQCCWVVNLPPPEAVLMGMESLQWPPTGSYGFFLQQTQALGFGANTYLFALSSFFCITGMGMIRTEQSSVSAKCLGSCVIRVCTTSVVFLTAIHNPRENLLQEKLLPAVSILSHAKLLGRCWGSWQPQWRKV